MSCRSCPFMRRTGKLESSSSQSVAPLTHAPSEYRARAAWTSLGPARASVLRRGCGLLPCPLLPGGRSDQRRLSPSGQPGGPRTNRLRSASVAASRAPSRAPGSRHVEQCLPRQPVAIVQEFSDHAALTRRHRCSPPIPGRPLWPEDHQQLPAPLSARDVAAKAPPTSAGRPVRSPTGTCPSTLVPSGTKCLAWSAARSTPKANGCPADPAPARSAPAQASTAACRSRRTTPARVSAVSTSIACLSNRTSSESSSQKQRQAAQPAQTCGNGAPSESLRPGTPCRRSAQQRSHVWWRPSRRQNRPRQDSPGRPVPGVAG